MGDVLHETLGLTEAVDVVGLLVVVVLVGIDVLVDVDVDVDVLVVGMLVDVDVVGGGLDEEEPPMGKLMGMLGSDKVGKAALKP